MGGDDLSVSLRLTAPLKGEPWVCHVAASTKVMSVAQMAQAIIS